MPAVSHPATFQLGTLLTEFRLTRTTRVYLILWIMLMAFGGFILIAAALAASANVFLYALSVILLTLGSCLIAYWVRNRQVRVQVYEQGIVYRRNTPSSVIRWEDIETVTQQAVNNSVNGVPVGTFYTFVLRTKRGETLKLTSAIHNMAELGTLVQHATYPYLLAQARTTYEQGGIVSFGRIAMDHQGLSVGQKFLNWNELNGVDVVRGYVHLKKRGKWLPWVTIAVAKTTNIHVFLALVDQHTTAITTS